MRRLALLGLATVVACGGGAVSGRAAAPTQTNECNGIRDCLRAQGPWVVVPARGEAYYLLDCPRRRGIAAGVDGVASSPSIHVSFDAQLGAPVAPGRTTTRYVFFRIYSTNGKRGFFQPRIGCIPSSPSSGGTVSYDVPAPQRTLTAVRAATAVPGPPLQLSATTIRVGPGAVQTSTIGCVPGQRLVRVWTARAFRTVAMPPVSLGDALDVQSEVRGKAANVAIASSEALPRSARAEVQLGVGCAQR